MHKPKPDLHGLPILHLKSYVMVCKSHRILKDALLVSNNIKKVSNDEDRISEFSVFKKRF